MTLQKEYELVCQIFNDNFKVENNNFVHLHTQIMFQLWC